MELRLKNALKKINKTKKGLEIGPAYNPLAPKKDGYNIDIIDHLDKEGLINKYKPFTKDTINIEDVDYVWNGKSYAETTGKKNYYDYIIASHLIEHTPDLITFLKNCEEILKDDGVLSLVIPDKRFCFDYYRTNTNLISVIDAFNNNSTKHSEGRIIDFFLNRVTNNKKIIWGDLNNNNFEFIHNLNDIKENINLYNKGEYVDIHSWVFTPTSFRLLINDLNSLGFINLIEECFFDTNYYEFYITLKKSNIKQEINRIDYLNKINDELINISSNKIILENENLKKEINNIYKSKSWKILQYLKKII